MFDEVFDRICEVSNNLMWQFDRLEMADQTKAYTLGKWTFVQEVLDYMRNNWGRLDVNDVHKFVCSRKVEATKNTYFRYRAFDKGYRDMMYEIQVYLV